MKKQAVLFLVFVPFFLYAQPSRKKQALSVELGKTGIIYNIAYDHKIAAKKYGFQVSVGFNFGQYLNLITAGAGLYYLSGRSQRFLESGFGLNYIYVSETSDDQVGFSNLVYPDFATTTFFINGIVGYRAYSHKTLFRIGLAPGFTKDNFVPGGYISFGILL